MNHAPADGAPRPPSTETPPPHDPPLGPFKRLTAVTLTLLAVCGLALRMTGDAVVAVVAVSLLLAFLVVGQALISTRERILVGAAIVLAVIGWLVLPDPGEVMWGGIQQSCFLAAFMVLIGILREPAKTSIAIDKLGQYLTRQPPSRRYVALTVGSAVLAALANIGALALLAPLIQAGVSAAKAGGDTPDITAIKERRQYAATLRGFALVVMFSPTTVTQALLGDLFPGEAQTTIIVFGFFLAMIWLVIGWAEDLFEGRVVRRGLMRSGGLPQRRPPLPLPGRALRDLGLIVAALIGAAVGITHLFDTETVPALMMTAPILTVVWIVTQNADLAPRARARAVTHRVGSIVTRSIPRSAPEAVTIASAGFIGTMLGALLPTDALAWTLDTGPVGHFLIIAAMPALIILAAQVALTPIVVAVSLSASYAALGEFPVSTLSMTLALSVGWALSLTASPYTAAPLILGRVTDIPRKRLTWGWNWIYNICVYVASVLYIGTVELMR